MTKGQPLVYSFFMEGEAPPLVQPVTSLKDAPRPRELSPARVRLITLVTSTDIPRDKLLAADDTATEGMIKHAGNGIMRGPLGSEGGKAIRALIGIGLGTNHPDRQALLAPDMPDIDPLDENSRIDVVDRVLQGLRHGILDYEGTRDVRALIASVVASGDLESTLNVLLADQPDVITSILAQDKAKLLTTGQNADKFLREGPLGWKDTQGIRALATAAFEPTR